MIRTFKDAATARLFADQDVPRFRAIERQPHPKLLLLDAVGSLADLRIPPGNRLEALKGARAGQHSIRINEQSRILLHLARRRRRRGRNRGLSLRVEVPHDQEALPPSHPARSSWKNT